MKKYVAFGKIVGWLLLAAIGMILIFTNSITGWLGFASAPMGLMVVLTPLAVAAIAVEWFVRRYKDAE